ncbi:MAG: fibronectin type III domain-containing protein [Thermoplasmata archaeon]
MPESTLAVSLYLYDPAQSEVAVDSPSGLGERVTVSWTTNSMGEFYNYYLRVEVGSGSGNYSMEVTLVNQNDADSGGDAADSEANVLPDTTTPITTGKHAGYLNTVTGEDSRDIYGINIDATKRITVSVTPESALSIDLYLLNETHHEEFDNLDSDIWNDPGETAEVSWAASTGDFVYIWLKGQGYGNYTIEIALEDVVPPTAVTLNTPREENIGIYSVELNWTENTDPDFDRYEIYVSGTSGALGELEETETLQSVTSTVVYGLSSDTTYYFTVRVVNTAELYTDSNQVTAKTKTLEEIVPPSFFSGLIALLLLVVLLPIIIIIVIVVVIVLVLRKKKAAPPPPPPVAPPTQPEK